MQINGTEVTVAAIWFVISKSTGLEIAGEEVDLRRDYLIAINSIFHDIAADGVNEFHNSPCVLLHHELIRDVVIKYLREKRYVSGELPGRVCPVAYTSP